MLLITVATIGVALEAAARLHVLRAEKHHRVAVDEPAVDVDEDGAIAVAVERDAEPKAAAAHQRRELLRDASSRIRG